MRNLGLLPAAGRASRFNGVYKELLPIGDQSLLERAVELLGEVCDEVLLVTTAEKISEHARVLGPRVRYAIQKGHNDIWSAIEESFFIEAERVYFMMPDCLTSPWPKLGRDDFVLGTFETEDPGRYGILRDGVIVNKDPAQPTPARAWGVLSWTGEVVEFWRGKMIKDYTDAFNQAMTWFGFGTFELDYYVDMASLKDYTNYLHGAGFGDG